MKFRIAKKIWKSVETDDEHRYSNRQLDLAYHRLQRTRSSKRAHAWWQDFFGNRLTVACRARCLPPAMALELLMNTDEADWNKTANQIKGAHP